MRKWNAILSGLILVLFLAHGILAGFQLIGVGSTALKAVAWAAVVLIVIHILIGVRLTAESVRVWKKTGVSYIRENQLVWARRLSGLAVMVLLAFHMTAFGIGKGEAYRLKYFGGVSLTAQLLLVAALALHILTNVKPLLIAFGIKGLRARTGDILIVLSVMLLFLAAAFIVYYWRWNR